MRGQSSLPHLPGVFMASCREGGQGSGGGQGEGDDRGGALGLEDEGVEPTLAVGPRGSVFHSIQPNPGTP